MATFAKYIDRYCLTYFRNPVRQDGRHIFTNDPTQFGFKPVIVPEPPTEEGYVAVPDGWEETETEIRQMWRLEPVPDDVDAEELKAELEAIL